MKYLTRRGLKLVERNYRCRVGELDLIMTDQNCLVFVEVRYRRSVGPVSPALTVDQRKQARLIRAARHYLMTHPEVAEQPCRFDVVGIEANNVDWISGAFEAG